MPSPSHPSARIDPMMQEPLGPSHIEGLKEQLERLKQTFHAEQLRMRRKFTSHNEQLKACTQSLQSLHVSCATDGSYLNDTQASQLSFNADASRPAAAQVLSPVHNFWTLVPLWRAGLWFWHLISQGCPFSCAPPDVQQQLDIRGEGCIFYCTPLP